LIRQALRSELGLSRETKLVVNVGRLTPPKNHRLLLRVIQRCKGTLPLYFLAVGHGELESELKDVAGKLGVSDCIRFLGLRHDIPEILLSADIFCFTSLSEGFPNALLEAMAAGLPIVTTHFPGADELIEHQRSGLIVPPNDEEAVTDALRTYVNMPELATNYGACAAKAARERFSIDRMVENTLAYYSCIARTPR
jgi:glycosyltransferase involved in cell wall biosynthesis